MSVFAIEFGGWGEAGPQVTISDVSAPSAGVRVLEAAGHGLTSADVGSRVRVHGITSLPSGVYVVADVDGDDVTITASVGATGAPVAAWLALEDPYRIVDGVPDGVASDNPRLRNWIDSAADAVSITAGQRVPLLGGIATVDGIEIRLTREATDAFCASMYPQFVSIVEPLTYTATSARVWGLSEPADGVYFLCDEAVYLSDPVSDTVDGVTFWDVTLRRGILGSSARSHIAGLWLVADLRTPIGLPARAYVDGTQVISGFCERWNLAAAGVWVAQIGSHVLAVHGLTMGKSSDVVQYTRATRVAATDFGIWYLEPRPRVGTWRYLEFLGFAVPYPIGENIWAFGDAVSIPTFADCVRLKLEDLSKIEQQARVVTSPRWYGTPDAGGPWFSVDARHANSDDDLRDIAPEARDVEKLTRVAVDFARPVNVAVAANDVARVGVMPLGYVGVHPVEAIRQILQSTGGGDNGDFDTLPEEIGARLPDSALDVASFDAAIDAWPYMVAANVAFRGDDVAKSGDVLSMLCRVYGFALVSDSIGRVRLVDLAAVTATAALGYADLLHGSQIEYSGDYSASLLSVRVAFDAPWAAAPVSEKINATNTAPSYVRGIATTSVDLSPTFAAWVDESSRAQFFARWRRIQYSNVGIQTTLTVQTVPTWSGDVGDLVSVALPVLPAFVAGETGGLDALGRIVNRVRTVRAVGESWDTVTIIVYGGVATDTRPLWSPTGEVDTVTDDETFTLDFADYGGDNLFEVGDLVWLWDEYMTTRVSVAAEVLAVDGDELTISDDWGVTPAAGDIVTHAERTGQPTDALETWAWMLDAAPATEWE